MTSLDQPTHPLADELTTVFAVLVEQGAIDIVAGDRDDAWEVQADQWTLAVEGWPLTLAFLAIDEEPSRSGELRLALHTALGPGDLAAMRRLDQVLDGALRQALGRSGDALSSELASYLAGGERG